MIANQEQLYVVDAGNTSIKIACFKEEYLLNLVRIDIADEHKIQENLEAIQSSTSILSSVLSDELTSKIINWLSPTLVLTHETPLPINIKKYKSYETLGVDRIANAVAAHFFAANKNALVIDVGTCVKFDFVNKEGDYLGGSISPGLSLRYKSLAKYTGRLPELSGYKKVNFLGENTQESIYAGVIFGITHEIKGFIDRYTQQFEPLTIFLTGGDHKYFDKAFKSSIFVDQNLTLKGLKLILEHNEM